MSGPPAYPPTQGYPQQPGYPPTQGYPPQPPGYGYEQLGPYLGPPLAPIGGRKSRKKLAIFLTAGLTLLLVVGGVGAWAAVTFWYSTGKQVEKAMPASVGAFMRVDLDPSADQAVKLMALIRKFPTVTKSTGSDVPELEKKTFESFGFEGLTYDADVKPWFGHKVGAGLWVDKDKNKYALMVLASSDDAKARRTLDQVKAKQGDGEFGFVVNDGWALIAAGDEQSQEAADAAAADAKQHPLADDPTYSKALAKLPSGQLAVGWIDVAKLKAQTGTDLGGAAAGIFGGSLGSLGADSSGAKSPLGDFNGWAIAGVQASDTGIEIRERVGGGAKPFQAGADVGPTMDALPGNSVIAAAFGPDPDTSRALVDLGSSLGSDLDDQYDSRSTPATTKKVTDAVTALLGSKVFSLSVTKLSGEIPGLRISADTGSDAAATKVVDGVGQLKDAGLTVDRNGSRVDLSTKGYAPSGTLAGQSLYRDAMAGAPAKPSFAFYVDLQAIFDEMDLDSADRAEVRPIKAVAGASGVDGGEAVGLLRLVIK